MKTLTLSIIAILTIGISTAHANPISIDGTVSLKGCTIINGNVTQATDIQNTTIQVCNYHGKQFKLSDTDVCIDIGWEGKITDPQTGNEYKFSEACDIPTTCGLKNSWGGPLDGYFDRLPVTVNGTQFVIITIYRGGLCMSESYNEQEKKASIIANGLYENDTTIHVLIPKVLLENVAVTINGQKTTPFVTDYPSSKAVPACLGCYSIDIHLPYSSTSEKTEIGAKSIPEFPFAIPVLLISILSIIVFYRIRFRK